MKNPPKKDVALALLEQGTIYVHLDPRKDGVVVPKEFRVQKELVLSFGYNTRVAIPDLDLDDDTLSGTLSFNRRPFWCRIPWGAVYAIVLSDKRGVSWPEDAPSTTSPSAAPPAKRSHLRAVGPDEGARDDAPESPAAPAGPGTCGACGIPWIEDASSCPVCGARREEAFQAVDGDASAKLARGDGDDDADEAADAEKAKPSTRPEPTPLHAVAMPKDEPEGDGEDAKKEGTTVPRVAVPEPALAVRPDRDDRSRDDEIVEDDPPPPPPPPKPRGHLRLVKK